MLLILQAEIIILSDQPYYQFESRQLLSMLNSATKYNTFIVSAIKYVASQFLLDLTPILSVMMTIL